MCLLHLENGIFIFMNSNSKYTWTESVPVHLDWWSNIFFHFNEPIFPSWKIYAGQSLGAKYRDPYTNKSDS